jgi:FtsH-binding integral membrane protein
MSTFSGQAHIGDPGADQVSDRTYNLTIGVVLCWGFAVNYVLVHRVPYEALLGVSRWQSVGLYFISIMLGTLIYSLSDNPKISLVGYHFVAAPLGLVLLRNLPIDSANSVAQAFLTTGTISAILMLMAVSNSVFFLSRRLMLALVMPLALFLTRSDDFYAADIIVQALVIVGMSTAALMLAASFHSYFIHSRGLMMAWMMAFWVELGTYIQTGHAPSFFECLFVLIFSACIGYNYARAQTLTKSINNAVDCAAALYMDIVIFFALLLWAFRPQDHRRIDD